LGANRPGDELSIDAVKLYPSSKALGAGFPLRFRIECSDDPAFQARQVIADWSKADFPDPYDNILRFQAGKAKGRYVRLTVTRLRGKMSIRTETWPAFSKSRDATAQSPYSFALAKIEILSGGADIGVHRPVAVDPELG